MLRDGNEDEKTQAWYDGSDVTKPRAVNLPLPDGGIRPQGKEVIGGVAEMRKFEWPQKTTYYRMWTNCPAVDGLFIDPGVPSVYLFQVFYIYINIEENTGRISQLFKVNNIN